MRKSEQDKPVVLYHVGLWVNMASIDTYGVHPRYSHGRQKCTWWVTGAMLLWALAHISARHRVSVDLLVVYRENMQRALLTRTAWPGVFKCYTPIFPSDRFNALHFTQEPELLILSKGELDHD